MTEVRCVACGWVGEIDASPGSARGKKCPACGRDRNARGIRSGLSTGCEPLKCTSCDDVAWYPRRQSPFRRTCRNCERRKRADARQAREDMFRAHKWMQAEALAKEQEAEDVEISQLSGFQAEAKGVFRRWQEIEYARIRKEQRCLGNRNRTY
jgi:hypothetical protein